MIPIILNLVYDNLKYLLPKIYIAASMYLTYFTRMNLYTNLSAIGIITEYCFRQLHSHALTHILQSCWVLEAFQRGRPESQSQIHLQLP